MPISIQTFNDIWGHYGTTGNSIRKEVFNLLDVETAAICFLDQIPATEVTIRILFSYEKDKPLIKDLNLSVLPGQRIAIVGPTGCGKTTVINLLMRFYDTDRGNIYVSDKDIKDMKRKTLRSMYGMVLQDTWLFEGTVRENIAYGKEDASLEEVKAAAKAAHAHSFIKINGSHLDIQDGCISQEKKLLSIAKLCLQNRQC